MLSTKSYRTVLLGLCILAASCSHQDDDIPTENRISLLGDTSVMLKQSSHDVTIPDVIFNTDWTQVSGLPFNDIGNLKGINDFSNVKKIYIGDTKDGEHEVTMQPVVSAGKAFFYTIDSELVALDLQTGKIVWKQSVAPLHDTDDNPRGGGLASDGGYVFVTTSNGIIAAYNTDTGKQIWRINNKVPLSAAPTLAQGILYVIDRDNRLQALDSSSGNPLWDYRGLPEPSAYSHVASASVFGTVLIAPFTSGELTAINIATQKPAWGQTLIGGGLNPGGIQFNTISGEVIISNRMIFASVPSGLIVALKGQTGETIWQHELGTAKTMLSAADSLFMIDTNATLYALDKQDGSIMWKRNLQQYEDSDDKTGLIEWTSPLMSNGNIVVFSNIGKSLIIDAKDGSVLHRNDDAPETIIDPIIASGKLLVHGKSGYAYIYESD
ncbi:MAG: outer membrane protein assembly factor BamB [Alphaproteobacteria bacterium]|jgi:outer membrane protein assembly factor BamB